MNDFIGNNIKLIIEWGQTITVVVALLLMVSMYLMVRKSRYFLPRGFLKIVSFVGFSILTLCSILVFARITYIKPNIIPILKQLDGLVGRPAPDLVYKKVTDNSETAVTDYRGKILLVNYWATWCKPCIKEIPDLQKIEDRYRDQGVKVIMISDEDRDQLNGFIQRKNIAMEVGYTSNFNWVDLGSERPATFLIDRDGKILEYFTGGHEFEFFEMKIISIKGISKSKD